MPGEQQTLTEDQAAAAVFDYSAQQKARAALAHVRLVQELTDVAQQGAALDDDQAAEVRALLDDVSPSKARKSTSSKA